MFRVKGGMKIVGVANQRLVQPETPAMRVTLPLRLLECQDPGPGWPRVKPNTIRGGGRVLQGGGGAVGVEST